MDIYKENGSIFFENIYVRIEISEDNALVKSIYDKINLKEIKGEDTHFFSIVLKDKTTIIPEKIDFKDDVIRVHTTLCDFDVKITSQDSCFTFELMTSIPKEVWKVCMAHAKYEYDYSQKSNCGAIGIALTYWANPCFYPDSKSKETKAEIMPHLRDKDAKYALIVAPINKHRDIIKRISLTIDKRYGIVTQHGGAWGLDSSLNYSNTIIPDHNSEEFVKEKIELFKMLGVQHVDFHKGSDSFCQGDFKYVHFADGCDFKERVTDYLEENGIHAGLHTYTAYIDYNCDSILSDPKWQKQLSVLGTYTLSEDVSENADFLPTLESTDNISDNFGFVSRNTPYILVGSEIMEFEKSSGGFKIKGRGLRTTQNTEHKKGDKIYHLDGYYHGISPIPGSELFYQIARNTAKAYNEGGYKCIYLDALEGIIKHCDKEDAWFYIASFVCEILAHCDKDPMVECSDTYPFLWPVRGRFGAYDTPAKGYKHWNRKHVMNNRIFADRFATTTLGWYDFYPIYLDAPANVNTKYHHTDDTHYMGSLALMYDLSMVYNEIESTIIDKYPAFYRNAAIYKVYDELRRKKYFSEELLQKIRDGKYEYHVVETLPGKYAFCEKDYQVKKIHNLADKKLNKATYNNPFKEQKPFIRIEALLSTNYNKPITIFESNINNEISTKTQTYAFEQEIDLSANLAKKVTVRGNGKKGTVAFIMECVTQKEKGRLKYYVDTDFEGCRDFILLESDNGMRPDLLFDGDVYGTEIKQLSYADYRAEFLHNRSTKITIETAGDTEGSGISSVVAYEHCYKAIKNPTVCIGEKKIVFDCNLMSTEYIEFDGEIAKKIDCFGNEEKISYSGNILASNGEFETELIAENSDKALLRAQLTLGFSGDIISE